MRPSKVERDKRRKILHAMYGKHFLRSIQNSGEAKMASSTLPALIVSPAAAHVQAIVLNATKSLRKPFSRDSTATTPFCSVDECQQNCRSYSTRRTFMLVFQMPDFALRMSIFKLISVGESKTEQNGANRNRSLRSNN